VLSVKTNYTTTPNGRRMYRLFGDNSATEFHKLRRGIWQNLPLKNGDPDDDNDDDVSYCE